MSDLRTRIAAAMKSADNNWAISDTYLGMADAVIRELQIKVEDGECSYCHAMPPGCRYSTWKATDE